MATTLAEITKHRAAAEAARNRAESFRQQGYRPDSPAIQGCKVSENFHLAQIRELQRTRQATITRRQQQRTISPVLKKQLLEADALVALCAAERAVNAVGEHDRAMQATVMRAASNDAFFDGYRV